MQEAAAVKRHGVLPVFSLRSAYAGRRVLHQTRCDARGVAREPNFTI
jgi:hypothetical protein